MDTVEAEMQSILSEAGEVPRRPLNPAVEVPLVERLADALNELAMYLTAAQRGGPRTDVRLEQENALMQRVHSAVRTFHTITGAR